MFADLGFANAEEELLKAKLVGEICNIIKRRKLTQAKAAALLGLKPPEVSELVIGRVGIGREGPISDPTPYPQTSTEVA